MSDITDNQNLNLRGHAHIAEAFETFAVGMSNNIKRHMETYFENESWAEAASEKLGRPNENGASDPYFQLLVLRRFWGPVFEKQYKDDLRPIINELIEIRNKWAHLSLPKDIESLEKAVLMMERILAPVNPEATIEIRNIRSRLKNPDSRVQPSTAMIDLHEIQTELEETNRIFDDLKKANSQLSDELSQSRKISAKKQLKLTALENQINTIQGKSLAFEHYLSEERQKRDRVEWLFVILLAVLLLVMAIGYN